MSVIRLIVLTVLLMASVPSSWGGEETDVLKTTAVTRYELGLIRLQLAAADWVEKYGEYPDLAVDVSIGDTGAINFTIAGTYGLRQVRSSEILEKKCKEIGRHFLKTLFSNYGDPSETDSEGRNLYYMSWGAYFVPPGNTGGDVEKFGKATSNGSMVTVRPGNPLLPDCSIMSDEAYSK
jgi:hypothetical protein